MEEWKYDQIANREYHAIPWSFNSLKPLWHKTENHHGNDNSLRLSKNQNFLDQERSGHSTFTQIIDFGAPEANQTHMSLDRGMSGNLFAGDYWSMQENFSKDKLIQISTDFRVLQNDENYKLLIKPLKNKKKRIIRPIEEALVDEKKKSKPTNFNKDQLDDWGDASPQNNAEDPDGINEYYR